MTIPERLKRAKPYDTGGPGGDCRGVRCYREKVAEETRQACLSVLIQ